VTVRAETRLLPLAIAGAVVLAALLVAWWLGVSGVVARLLSLSTGDVEDLVASWGMWGVGVSLLLMVLHSFVPVPAEVIAVANGLCFGAVRGAVVTWSGAMLGAALAFALARGAGRPLLRRAVSEARRARLEAWCGSAGTLLLLRLIPAVSFNLVNYAAGLTGASWWTFLWTTALGILPLTILTAVLGARMFEIAWPVWAAIGAAMVALWSVGWWWRGRR